MNESPAPVVSTSSEGGIFSAVPKSILPVTVPIPLACNFATPWRTKLDQHIIMNQYLRFS